MYNLSLNSFDAAIAAKTAEECQQIIDKFYSDIENAGLQTYNKFINDQYQAIKAKNAQ